MELKERRTQIVHSSPKYWQQQTFGFSYILSGKFAQKKIDRGELDAIRNRNWGTGSSSTDDALQGLRRRFCATKTLFWQIALLPEGWQYEMQSDIAAADAKAPRRISMRIGGMPYADFVLTQPDRLMSLFDVRAQVPFPEPSKDPLFS